MKMPVPRIPFVARRDVESQICWTQPGTRCVLSDSLNALHHVDWVSSSMNGLHNVCYTVKETCPYGINVVRSTAGIYWVLSAYRCDYRCHCALRLICSVISSVQAVNSNGPRTDPCGMLQWTGSVWCHWSTNINQSLRIFQRGLSIGAISKKYDLFEYAVSKSKIASLQTRVWQHTETMTSW